VADEKYDPGTLVTIRRKGDKNKENVAKAALGTFEKLYKDDYELVDPESFETLTPAKAVARAEEVNPNG
jgi:hypothetical protein